MDYFEITKEHKANLNADCIPFCVERVGPNIDDRLHIHDFCQLTIITAGNGTLVLNGFSYPVRTGDVYVIGSLSTHYLKEVRGLECVNILFYLQELEPLTTSLSSLSGYQALFQVQPVVGETSRASNIFPLDYNQIEYVNHLLSQLLAEQTGQNLGKNIVIQSVFMLLITYLCRNYCKGDTQRVAPYSYQLQKAVQYLEENCGEQITQELLEKGCGATSRQLRYLFAQHYDCTPLQYLLNIRIRKACYYLVATNLSIAEIATVTGFEDNNYFSRKFRQILGISPRDYRNQSRVDIHGLGMEQKMP